MSARLPDSIPPCGKPPTEGSEWTFIPYHAPPNSACQNCGGALLVNAVAPVGGIATLVWCMVCDRCSTIWTFWHTDHEMVDQ
jgi:hypothetical protein